MEIQTANLLLFILVLVVLCIANIVFVVIVLTTNKRWVKRIAFLHEEFVIYKDSDEVLKMNPKTDDARRTEHVNASGEDSDICFLRITECVDLFKQTACYEKIYRINKVCKIEKMTLTMREREEFIVSIQLNFAKIIIELKERYPLLTRDEIYFCIFLLLDCSNHAIALVMGISNGAIRVKKSRIRKKLGDSNLFHFFNMNKH